MQTINADITNLKTIKQKATTINVSTGPVQISPKVLAALSTPPVSHRSKAFHQLYYNTTNYLCQQLNVKTCYLLTGSGTAANEAMLHQIKIIGGKGLILSNGEFGERLIAQALRTNLNFIEMRLDWGQEFNTHQLEKEITQQAINWVLFCHCETSTGVMNDLNNISTLCKQNNCLCFVDCMSTIGTHSIDLSMVAMATASSGKGLASIPGLAIVLSNIETLSAEDIPCYFDLRKYDEKEGIPYTISSNLVYALQVAIKLKFEKEQLSMINEYAQQCYHFLSNKNVLPFNNAHSKVFTIALPRIARNEVINKLTFEGLVFSCESEYLEKRSWLQMALLGYYIEDDLRYFINSLKRSFWYQL